MGLFGKLLRVTLDVIETPIAIVKDVATMGGVLTDQNESYTQQKFNEISDDYRDLKDEVSEL